MNYHLFDYVIDQIPGSHGRRESDIEALTPLFAVDVDPYEKLIALRDRSLERTVGRLLFSVFQQFQRFLYFPFLFELLRRDIEQPTEGQNEVSHEVNACAVALECGHPVVDGFVAALDEQYGRTQGRSDV